MRGSALGLICALLSGCAWFRGPPAPVQVTPGQDEVAQQLAEAAGRAEEALGRLSRIEATRDPIEWNNAPEIVPDELMQEVTLDWTGPIGELAQRLAHLSGYEFQETGADAVVPVLVDVHSVERPLIAILREVGYQGGMRVKVVVDARRRRVEVVHRAQ